MTSIGFVGVGRMGANMARRLKDCGFTIAAVLDSNPEAARELARELGTQSVDKYADVTRLSDVIITVVSDDAAMRQLYRNSDDNLLMGARGKLFINCATITPSVHVEMMAEADRLGAKMLECPMASSIPQAREGTLFLMVAGERSVFDEAQPILTALSKTAVYTGAPGSAAQIKALVNMVMNINTAALAEGLGLADALGLDLTLVREIFSKTGANSRVLETDAEDMQNREHEAYFSAAHAAKDSGIAARLGQEQGLPMVLAKATQNLYDEMVRCGLGDLDKSGISELSFKDRRTSLDCVKS